MAATMLQYAMVDLSGKIDVPLPGKSAGCAAADVAARYNAGTGKTFSDLIRATTASPAFVVRAADLP
jgi:hypothetical protein